MSYDDDIPFEDEQQGNRRQSQGGRQSPPRRGGRPDLENYVEVKERIQQFYEKWPEGRLQSAIVMGSDGGSLQFGDQKPRVIVKALAYRTPDDTHPGIGFSWMELPGTTPYTRGSELENTETSAWGRAIASLGIAVDRGIASAQEVRNKTGDQPAAVVDLRERLEGQAERLREGNSEPRGEPLGGQEPQSTTPAPRGRRKPRESQPEPEDKKALTWDEFKAHLRESFIPAGMVTMEAARLFPSAHSVKDDLDDAQRFQLMEAMQARVENTKEVEVKPEPVVAGQAELPLDATSQATEKAEEEAEPSKP